MTTPTAEVVATKEGKPIPFLPFVVQKINGFDEEYLYSFKSEEEAKREVDEWLCTSSVLRARILRLPSEREAELQPLRDAVNRAAIKYAESKCAHDHFDYCEAREKLAAAEAAMKGAPDA